MLLTTPTPLFNGMDSKWKYPIDLLAGRKLLESHVVDSTEIPVLLRYGIASSQYRHDGYYPRAFIPYVESFGFELVKSYTIGFPSKVSKAFFLARVKRDDIEITLRSFPIVNLLGITNVALFRTA